MKVMEFWEDHTEKYEFLNYVVRCQTNLGYLYAHVKDRIRNGIFCFPEPHITNRDTGKEIADSTLRLKIQDICKHYHIDKHFNSV